MDYEKRYKEAIEAMEDCIPDKDGYVCVRPCDIFPELAESEDEKIRNALIIYLKCRISGGDFSMINNIIINDMLAWFERQKPAKWTEEDEHHWMMCLECVEECATQKRKDFSKTISWLKQLKQRLEQ